jgi:ATP-dependent exoDNAse (exonuclease V) beta subunit
MADITGLNIFKASAGSGKTFRLVGEYLKMLFARPSSYKNILAVTFTNKATAEMKERILKELANLSTGKESRYLDFLKEFGGEQKIRLKATNILKLILHDYSRFSVMTIDSFFQKVIRSFAREIRLNASFRTEIDNRQALEDAVDLLFQEIDENALLKEWMVLFLEENLEEGRSWDFKKELLKFAKEVEKEAFKVHGDELLETLAGRENLSQYVATMKAIVSDAGIRLKSLGVEGLSLISASGLTYDQMKGGKNSFANLFNKLAGGKFDPPTPTMSNARNQLENWVKKTDPPQLREKIENLYHHGLNRLLNDSLQALAEEIPKINSAQAILKNIYPFGLLGNIALKVKEVLSENNTVLLSDSGRMIGRIIEGSDTPFIYEKVGLIYRHFMLDEFQDTSRQQWSNFKPLVENALASGNSSLVVGDVKQSIYRWRNGDWNLLANQLASDLSHQIINTEELLTNWRSKKKVVDFNNTLFWRASGYLNTWFDGEMADAQFSDLSGVIAKAYEDHHQICSKADGLDGYVKISFVETEGTVRKSEFREKALVLLIEQLESVQKLGVLAEEITILVRENSEAELIAKALWKKKKNDPQPGCRYDVITSDTLKIGQSPVVRFVVNFFKFFTRKDPQLIRAEILYGYYRILFPMMDTPEPDPGLELHQLFDAETPLTPLFESWLENETQSEFLTGLLALPLFELAVTIADHFHLGKITGEKLYLQSFLDLVLEYGREESGGISGFLEWWETSGSNKTLNLPVIRNFIRISTIHQSKGLEYHTVFIPFCNWEIAIHPNKIPFIWSIPESEPFNMLKMVLLKCDKSLKDSVFSHDYYQEMLFSIMDNLNLLYVAMTRAVNHLFIIMPYKEAIKQLNSVSDLIQNILEQPFMPDSIDQEKYKDFSRCWNAADKIFESGEMVAVHRSEESPGAIRKNDPLILNSNTKRMEIRLHSKDYFLLTGDRRTERINKGTVMHQVFEKIRLREDIRPAVNQMITDGLINPQEGEEMFSKIDTLLQEQPFSDWFGDQWKVLNERDILRAGASKHRPDRVMLKENNAVVIDYKTGEKSDKDIRQMKGYLTDLRSMGFENCEGNIWYLQKNEIIKVEPST